MKASGKGTRIACSLTAVSGLLLTLTACGGGVSGEFFNGDGLLKIDGDSAVFTDFTCSEGEDSAELDSGRQFNGELTKDGEQIMWDMQDQSAYSWTPAPAEPIIESNSGEQITVGDQQFQKMSEDEALKKYAQAEC